MKGFKAFKFIFRNRQVRAFLTDVAQGVAQDEVMDRIGINKPVVGPPSLGGVVATGLRNGSKFAWDSIKNGQPQQPSNGPHSQVELKLPPLGPQRLQVLGIRPEQAKHLAQEDFDKIDSETLKILQGVLDLPSDLMNALQREQIQYQPAPLERHSKV